MDLSEIPTPETDEATSDCVCNSCEERDVVPRKVSQDLERRLAVAREALECLLGKCMNYRMEPSDIEVEEAKEALTITAPKP